METILGVLELEKLIAMSSHHVFGIGFQMLEHEKNLEVEYLALPELSYK